MSKRNVISVAWMSILMIVAGLGIGTQGARASVLTFQVDGPGTTLGELESTFASYGDNISSTSVVDPNNSNNTYHYLEGNGFTPNLTVGYSHSGTDDGHLLYQDSPAWPDQVDYLRHKDGTVFTYTFTNDGGAAGIRVNSFNIETYSDIGGWSPGTVNWFLRQDNGAGTGTILFSGSQAVVASNPYQSYSINTLMTGLYTGGPLIFQIVFSGTDSQGVIGIDDINFDQPEPASFALLAVGAAVLLKKRRPSRQ